MADDQIDKLKRRVNEQCRVLGSLASSLECGDRLKELINRVEKPCEALSSLAGAADVGFVLSWPKTRDLFLQYLDLGGITQGLQSAWLAIWTGL